ncbi:TadE/TadG family type IV pilus assembly protein [Myxococcus sp. RHSTA-1-4]|uniref:TadE/TadG family type IV pilus assembly protein n=1 Tax=Myxococcus sp. RHSTA-1-4 TaxID=2874601 RepID=UPI001CBE7CCB|nr:TadE family protein [Myxococcus sp. RHSTA-1-4]MBZ4418696.1 pilus assembly protein [Myxococcus sp. RHSTA-1-4]
MGHRGGPRRQGQSGQAAVEAALTLPLVVFLVLGTLQLFLMLQARILAQVAVYRAVRAGSLNHGQCLPMMHSALVTMLPTVARTDSAEALADAFSPRRHNHFHVRSSSTGAEFNEPLVEIVRESPDAEWAANLEGGEDLLFDQPTNDAAALRARTLEIRMVAWYYMRIPFANWVMSRMFLAHFALQRYTSTNPLMPAQRRAAWWGETDETLGRDGWPGGDLSRRMVEWSERGHYLFPIQVSAAMRMMTPVRSEHFQGGPACNPHG